MAIPSYQDVVFPLRIAFGATVTSERKVEVIALASGREQRNARLARSRRTYDAGTGVRSIQDLRAIMDFYEARRGPTTSFRFRDPVDNSSRSDGGAAQAGDQIIGTGNGANLRFALSKTYGAGSDAYVRKIKRPVAASVKVAVNGVAAVVTDFSVDVVTGEVVFVPAKIPPNNAIVTAGFEFHVEVRFASETLSANLTAFNAGEVPSIPLIEVHS
ncbi:MAG: phage distal tail protein, Rcc01695 family [Rhizobiaceae bacterium]